MMILCLVLLATAAALYFWYRLPAKVAGMSLFGKLTGIFGAGERGEGNPPLPPVTPRGPTFDLEDARIPDAARTKIRRILACIEDVERALQREPVPGASLVDLENMRDVHLPKLARSYVEIPASYRSEVFRKTGKSASFILLESLDKMQAKIDDILRNLAQNDLDAFTENAQFIGQRYGDSDNPFA